MANLPTNAKTTEVHISQIMKGDTILHNGQMTTVCKNDITESSSYDGTCLFGDSYRMGTKKVTKVTFLVPTVNGIIER